MLCVVSNVNCSCITEQDVLSFGKKQGDGVTVVVWNAVDLNETTVVVWDASGFCKARLLSKHLRCQVEKIKKKKENSLI